MTLPAATAAEKRRFEILAREIGCLIHRGTPAHMHHLIDPKTGNRVSHAATIPLCPDCHHMRHSKKLRFWLKYGSDEDALIVANRLVAEFEGRIV